MDQFDFLSNMTDNFTNLNTNILPLWNLRKKDKKLVEFQLFAEKIEEQNNNDILHDINHNSIICHICNLNIPKLFIKQHSSSLKHKTFKNIIELCLDRLKLQLNNQADDNVINHINIHYCDVCTIVVKENEKEIHNLTETHIKNKAKEKLLVNVEKFLFNYEDFNMDEIFFKNQVTLSKLYDFVPTIAKVEEPLVINENINIINKETNEANIATSSKNDKYDETEINISTYNQVSIARENLTNDVSFNHNFKTHHNEAKIKRKNYLGKRNKKYVFCKLCVTNITDATEHLQSDTHIANINYLKDNNIKKIKESYCKLCNVTVIHRNIHAHLQSIDHNEKLKTLEFKNTHTFDQFVTVDDNRLKCKFCDDTIPTADSINHLQSSKHIQIVNSVLNKNKMRLTPSDRYFCEICNLEVLKMFEYVHITNKIHLDNFDMTKLPIITKTEEESISKDNDQSVNEFNNQGNTNQDNVSEYDAQIKELNEEFENLKANSPENFQTNSQNDGNKEFLPKENNEDEWPSLNEQKDINYKNKKTNNIDVTNKTRPVIASKNVLYLFEVVKNEKLIRCRVCFITVPRKRKTYHDHVNGKKHCQNYDQLLSDHCIKVFDYNIWCRICNIYISKGKELVHIKSTEHRQNLKVNNIKIKEIQLYYCKICDVKIINSDKYIKHHLNFSSHKRNERLQENNV